MEKKIVLITGASSGIGEGCARKFAMNGYRLILNGRNVEKLNAVKRELEENYRADVYLLPFDVRDRQAAKTALDSLPEEWKEVDILINNAGLVIGVDKEHEGNLDEWDVVLDTDVKALLAHRIDSMEKFDRFIYRLSNNKFRLPTLLKKYLKINARILAFNVDPDFNYCVDGLIMLNLTEVPKSEIDSLSKEFEDKEMVYHRFDIFPDITE